MAKDKSSRRNFLATLAAGGAVATTQLSPFSSLANSPLVSTGPSFKPRNPDEPIRIVSMMKLSPAEVEQIKRAGKNIELVIITDAKDPKQFSDAEVIF